MENRSTSTLVVRFFWRNQTSKAAAATNVYGNIMNIILDIFILLGIATIISASPFFFLIYKKKKKKKRKPSKIVLIDVYLFIQCLKVYSDHPITLF